MNEVKNTKTSMDKSGLRSTFMRLPFEDDLDKVDIAVIGVPWDGGTRSGAGSREGPRTIRHKSSRIQPFHTGMRFSPFNVCSVADIGDVDVNPFNQAAGLKCIEAFYETLTKFNVTPVSMGGDHLITLPILRAIAHKEPVGLVHFDAHHDMATTSIYGDPYASSTPFRHAIDEGLVDPKRVIQIGIRGSVPTFERERWARESGVSVVTMDDFYDKGIDEVIRLARQVVGDNPTYITFDIDGIDPAFAPGTGAPVIGGLTTYESLRILRGLRGLNLIGGDVNEVSPAHDVNDSTSFVGASLLYEILCLVAEVRSTRAHSSFADQA